MLSVIIIGIIMAAPIIFALLAGIKAWRWSATASREQALVLRLLALTLCEPLVNTVLVGLLVTRHVRVTSTLVTPETLIACTAPMIVLLVPVIGVLSAAARRASVLMLLSGIARWVLTVIVLTSAFVDGLNSEWVIVLALVLSLGVLLATTLWGKRYIPAGQLAPATYVEKATF